VNEVSDFEAARSALHKRSAEILALTEQLVRINSYSANTEGVNAVGQTLVEALAPHHLTVVRTPSATTGDHLTFSTKAADAGPAILLIGHHDTVFPPGSFDGFRVEGDLAHGPGVLDMKSALAMVIVVLRALADVSVLNTMPLRFISVGDEETGSHSSRPMLETLAKQGRCGLVFEAGRAGDAIITMRRGSGNAIVKARGRAAHAGNALSEGRNAIWALAKFIDRAQPLTDFARGVSVNVGLVRGGTSRNTVAEHAVAELDLRFSDASGRDALLDSLHEVAREASHEIDGCHLEVEVQISRNPLMQTADSHALCQRYAACQLAAGMFASESPLVGGGSDANTVATVGLPVIDGLGPRGRHFHTHDEYIEISSLLPKAEALLRFLFTELHP
jgi:glutamate carboxypeptidase